MCQTCGCGNSDDAAEKKFKCETCGSEATGEAGMCHEKDRKELCSCGSGEYADMCHAKEGGDDHSHEEGSEH